MKKLNSDIDNMGECFLCRSNNICKFLGGITRCINCDVIYRNKPFESRKYFVKEESEKPSIKDIKFWEIIAKEYLKFLKQKTEMNFKNVLDIGSYFGHFVKMLNDYGVNAKGIEANKTRVLYAKTDKINVGYFDLTFKTNEKFDLICFTQMLYYLPNGTEVLNFTKTLLMNNGLIFIATINPSSSLIINKKIPAIGGEYVNMLLSKKNFQALINFDVLEYVTYKSDIFIDLYQKKKLAMVKYLIGMKKPYTLDPDGNHAFILLKPRSI